MSAFYISGVEVPMWMAAVFFISFITGLGKQLSGLTWKEYFAKEARS